MSAADAAAHVRVLRGKPTAEQLAAVVAALRVVLTQAERNQLEAEPRSMWGRAQMRSALPHGSGLWTQSLRNR
ncbi:MAG: acyl-CoA carboxylase subunit epsilon [Actinobacteria bacterium]|nr:acyl-CoA carboxylase subunit epsilon [Actinomycetota bacterium]